MHDLGEAERRATSEVRLTGLRLTELVALDIGDARISARKGLLVVRSGKGDRYREVPLNRSVRHALEAWLKVRSKRLTDGEPALYVRSADTVVALLHDIPSERPLPRFGAAGASSISGAQTAVTMLATKDTYVYPPARVDETERVTGGRHDGREREHCYGSQRACGPESGNPSKRLRA